MIDCGYDRDKGLLDRKLKKAGIGYRDIHWLFLTHHHGDHTGLVNYLIERNPEMQRPTTSSGPAQGTPRYISPIWTGIIRAGKELPRRLFGGYFRPTVIHSRSAVNRLIRYKGKIR